MILARPFAATFSIIAVISSLVVPARAHNGPPHANASCTSPRYVQALGWACPVPGGYEVLLGDGTTKLTHGHDPAPDEGRGRLDVVGRQPSCLSDATKAFHVQLVYVRPPDQPDEYSKNLGQIRRMARLANGVIFGDARRFGRSRSLRMICSGSEPTVKQLTLSVPNDLQDFAQVVTEVRRAGFTSPLAKYWIYYDGRPPDAPAGTGTFENDSALRASNISNFGPGYAVTWGYPADTGGAGVMLHELGHTLGAVQNDAPNASGAAHCNDGPDIMCYDDNGSTSNYRNNVCKRTYFDCGNNDYFHPRPAGSNYLHDNWNLGSPWNRFMAGCMYRTQMLSPDPLQIVAGAQQTKLTLDAGARLAIPRTCRGRAFGVSAAHLPLPEVVYDTAGVSPFDPGLHWAYSLIVPSNVDICFFKGSRQLQCFAAAESEQGIVPRAATHAQVSLAGGLDGLYVLNID